MPRAHNFSAGPATLPKEVLEKVQAEILEYEDAGASIIEMSHRSKQYAAIDEQAKARVKRLLGIGDDYTVLFLQNGASGQFMMVPYNFLSEDQVADYIDTGRWSDKAITEAELFGKVNVPFSSKEQNYNRVPTQAELELNPDAEYVHFTSNNTVVGTQFPKEPDTFGVPLVCDASSDFLSRPIDIERYGLLYAGAQKNAGPAGVTIVVVRNDFLAKAKREGVPTILSYLTHAGKIFNTPPVFAVYMCNYVFEWIEDQGGLDYFKTFNQEKADLVYNEIDSDDFYRGTTEKSSRSIMNATFRLPSEELEARFLEEAKNEGMIALKGHRSVGGIRASMYNALPMESVETLVDFMRTFRDANG